MPRELPNAVKRRVLECRRNLLPVSLKKFGNTRLENKTK